MLNWLRTWWENRNRAIFWFRYNGRWCAIDPMIPYAILMQHKEFSLDDTPKLVDVGHLPSIELTARAAREAFNVAPLDENGRGMSQGEVIQLMKSFVFWMADIKKKGSILRTSTGHTESEEPESATKSDSPSFSIPTGLTNGGPSLRSQPSSQG